MTTDLVTGGTGFVGRELVRQLLDRGDKVAVLSRRRPLEEVKWLECDLLDAKGLSGQIAQLSPDVIYHLASLPGDTGNPQEMVEVNVTGLTNLLEAARASKVSRCVHSSSISAYEWFPATPFRPPLEMPVTEDHPCRPCDMYSSTKRIQEILVETYFHQYQLPTSILRLTAVVGPGGAGGGRMWREFAEQLQAGDKGQLPLKSPEELSHFVDLRDVAQMHLLTGEHPAAVGETFNCCASQATRGSEFAAIVESLVPGIQAAFGFPWSMAQGGEIEFDMSKMKRLLGFAPQYTLRDAVQSIYDWVQAGGLKN